MESCLSINSGLVIPQPDAQRDRTHVSSCPVSHSPSYTRWDPRTGTLERAFVPIASPVPLLTCWRLAVSIPRVLWGWHQYRAADPGGQLGLIPGGRGWQGGFKRAKQHPVSAMEYGLKHPPTRSPPCLFRHWCFMGRQDLSPEAGVETPSFLAPPPRAVCPGGLSQVLPAASPGQGTGSTPFTLSLPQGT